MFCKKFMFLRTRARVCLLTLFLVVPLNIFSQDQDYNQQTVRDEFSDYNFVLGTQAIRPSYQFTNENPDVESARRVLEMGSNILKTALTTGKDFETVVALPFKYILIWWHQSSINWYDGLSPKEEQIIYTVTYNYAKKLLTQYKNSGKEFYIGHWEGDWFLLPDQITTKIPPETAFTGMIAWLKARQRAVDDARRDVGENGVKIFNYVEVNRVLDAMLEKKPRVVNRVLKAVNPDFVSYSCYDMQKYPTEVMIDAMNYIQSQLSPKPNITGKRVFIGEFGIKAADVGFSPKAHEQVNREIMLKLMRWGSPFILYWEMYNNEVLKGRQLGFWLIDDKNKKWDLYFTFQNLYKEGKNYVAQFKTEYDRLPSREEYLTWAATYLESKQTFTTVSDE